MNTKKRRADWIALLLGLTATGGVVTAYCTGWLDWLEGKTYDLRVVYANSVRECDDLVRIEIDDRSLSRVGSWPWQRFKQAELIRIPGELGARAILVDIEWLEHATIDLNPPPHVDMAEDLSRLSLDEFELRASDQELAAAIAEAGNVYLAFHYKGMNRGDPDREAQERIDHAEDFIRKRMQLQPELGAKEPALIIRQLFADYTKVPFENESREKDAFVEALRLVYSTDATMRKNFTTLALQGVALSTDRAVPVYYMYARAAERCGFVVVEEDADGVVRRLPLLARHGDIVMPQLAFGLACDLLGVSPRDIRVQDRKLVVGSLRIQIDAWGRAVIPWVSPQPDRSRDERRHIPAAKIMEVGKTRGHMRRNEEIIAEVQRLRSKFEELSRTPYGDLSPEDQHQWDQLEFALTTKFTDDRAEACRAANERLRRELDDLLAELRTRIEGKICLIGYTATALADMTPIPGRKRSSGVYAHYSLLNGLLSGQVVSWASTRVNALVAVGFGVLASVVSLSLRPRSVVVIVVLLVLAFVAVAAAAFQKWTYSIAITPTVGTIFVSYFAIAAYRYMFADRERRHLATALGQYTSKEIARQVAENPELCRRAEVREVTSIFTDLKDFTTISERIGAERTQHVLNACLGRLTEIMLQYEALVNKFMGDGIFAFWNPVIYPQENHAGLACDTAIDLHVGLRKLIDEQRAAGGDPVFGQLVLRVGLASGKAVVGPCGSEQKFDYTCIGDSVNLASRLETANKFFGTSILVNGVTRDAAGDRFEFRPLGRVQVKGKQKDVPVYELLGRTGEVNGERLDHARRFGEAIAAFQERKWEEAQRIFEECSRKRPDDPVAKHYAVKSAIHAHEEPGEDWNSAIELTEK